MMPVWAGADYRRAAREAHRLKSAAGSVGADRLHSALTKLNDVLRGPNPERAETLLPEFMAAAAEVVAWSDASIQGEIFS